MTIEDDIAFFERVPILHLLGRGALRILAIGAESRYVHGGEVLFSAGDQAEGGYVVQEGAFSLTSQRSDEDVTVGPGTLLGELALFAESERVATATATEPSTVLRIPRSLFLKTLESFPEAARKLRDILASRADMSLREIQRVREALEQHDARGRREPD